MKCKLLIITLLVSAYFHAQLNCFYSPSTYTFSSGGNFPSYISTGDFNTDGTIDLAVANSNKLVVFGGNGNGIFSQLNSYTSAGQFTNVVACNFNNDLNLDLVFSIGSQLWWGMGNGTGNFTLNLIPGALGCSHPIAIANSDLNNDLKSDVVITSGCGASFYQHLGNGTGGVLFSSPTYTPSGNIVKSIVIKDLNNDSFKDMAIVHETSNNISVLFGNSSASYTNYIQYNVGNGPTGIDAADLNNDGFNDLVVANSGSSDYSVLLGSANGSFTSAISYSLTGSPTTLKLSDFNADGKMDLSICLTSINKLAVLYGNGNGTFSSATYLNTGNQPVYLSNADINNDNKNDLIVSNYLDNTIQVWLNGHINLSVTNSSTICEGQQINLSANGANSYTWSTNSNLSFITVSPTISTNYSVVGTNTSSGCSDSKSIAISVLPKPIINILSTSSLICVGQSASLTATGGITYTWSNSTSSTQIVVSPSVTTSYSVMGENSSGCQNSNSILINVSSCTNLNARIINDDQSFKIWPNPSVEVINIESMSKLQEVIICDLNGKVHYSEQLNEELIDIDTSFLSPGLYILIIKTSDTSSVYKFIKE